MHEAMPTRLDLGVPLSVRVSNAGLFISRGEGAHPSRTISSYELIFVQEGTLDIQEEGVPFQVGAGETLLLWPWRRHRGTAPYPPRLSFYWLHFEALRQAGSLLGECLSVPQHVKIHRPDHLISLFRRFLDDQETLGVQPLPAALLLALMLYEVSNSSRTVPVAGAGAVLAGRADALIRTSFHKPLSASAIARELHRNPDYLERVFRRAYGRTLTEAIHQRRVKHACRLLLEGRSTITRIAEQSGFNDVVYFRKLFKRLKGITPRAYRQMYAQQHINTE